MSFLKTLWRRILSGGEPDAPLVEMIRAAKVDPQIQASLVMILRMDTLQRRAAIAALAIRLRIQQAPEALISALAQLDDDEFAAITLSLLDEDS